MINVSYSALECYEQCSEKYRLRYEERLSSNKIPSPLFFGTAIDAAVEMLLLSKKEILTDRELDLLLKETALSIFDKTMREQNGEKLETNPLCDYFLSDFDESVLKIEDLQLLENTYKNINDFHDFFIYCKKQHKQKEPLKDSYKIIFNHMCWLSLYRKGEFLIEAYERDILPQIHRVYEIQKDIILENASGDRLRGKIDFIASFEVDINSKYIVDNKTSSKAYSQDSVANSIQLAIYCEAESIDKAGYVVMEKQIRSKDPRARTQLVLDKVSEEQKQKVFDKVEFQLNNISTKVYEKKSSPKECFQFGRACEFYKFCWEGDMDGLKKRPERV